MQVLSALLRSSDCRVLEATPGKEALDHQNGPIDLLISDVAVTVISGTEVALELNKSHHDVDFLEKPFRAAELLDKVGELIEGHAHHELTITAPPEPRKFSTAPVRCHDVRTISRLALPVRAAVPRSYRDRLLRPARRASHK
jgi:DNA-binding response OmpR family regulator